MVVIPYRFQKEKLKKKKDNQRKTSTQSFQDSAMDEYFKYSLSSDGEKHVSIRRVKPSMVSKQ